MGCFACFDGGASKQRRKEEEQLASQEARAKAAEAAQKRQPQVPFFPFQFMLIFFLAGVVGDYLSFGQEQFEQSAAGRAARAQQAAIAKQSANTNKGEPVLKWQMG
ncbi:hypothetical protein ACH5RR_027090 [Cinchona calisaya]|uniref:Small VCP/p97-interacting protein n=1 Tax=Cinchona calisaya TaxID=153742 RepID=A0ABD2Z5G4_9GENT